MRHTHLEAREAYASAVAVGGSCLHQREVVVDLVLKTVECEIFVSNAVDAILGDGRVIKNLGLREVLSTQRLQLGDGYVCDTI